MRSEILALLDQGDDSTPVAYAIVNDVPLDTQKHFRKHEGIEILSYDTQGGKDFSGFDDYLGAIYEATNPLVRFGRLLEPTLEVSSPRPGAFPPMIRRVN